MRFCSLGSGSGGNATVVEATSGTSVTRVLIDCGFSARQLAVRLARAGLAIDDLDAVFVTHEHGDHVGCALTLARRHGRRVWMSRGTWQAIGEPESGGRIAFASDGGAVHVGDLALLPYAVPHDACEPLQLRISDGASTLGVLTDAGSITPELLARLEACDALLLECNHDAGLLAASGYPTWLKARIAGPQGHLGNHQSAQVLAAAQHAGLKHVVAAHLSAQNNRPALAQAALAQACGAAPGDILVADPLAGCDWLALD